MLVPAVCVGVFLDRWGILESFEGGDVGLRGTMAVCPVREVLQVTSVVKKWRVCRVSEMLKAIGSSHSAGS